MNDTFDIRGRKMKAEKLIERAKQGQNLTKDQRRRALKELLKEEEKASSELADLFNVAERTIYRDKKAVRRELSEKLRNDYGLAGALYTEYRKTRKELDKVKDRAEKADDMELLRKAVKDRWKVTTDFYDRILDSQIINRIEKLEEQFKRK